MPPLKDLTGKIIGDLVVLDRAPNSKTHVAWNCKCSCGNIVVVRAYSLIEESVKHCGCKDSIVGNKYGRLTILKVIKPKEDTLCECLCDCGKIVTIKRSSILCGHTSSCGCLRRDRALESSFRDLTGQRFGKLLILNLITRTPQSFWECLCDCGKSYVARQNALISGNTKSCGCGSLEALARYRTKHGKSHTKEMRSFWSKRRRERKLELDFKWTDDMEGEIRKFYPKCVLCGSTDRMAVDHILPLSKGYGLEPGNATILCKSCNSRKHDKVIERVDKEEAVILEHTAEHFYYYWNMVINPLPLGEV